jgi:GAF domain-containing protein
MPSGPAARTATLRHLIDAARLAANADGAALMLFDQDGALCLAGSVGAGARPLALAHRHFGEGPCLACCERRKVIAVPDVRADSHWPGVGLSLELGGLCSLISAPVEVSGEVVGVLAAYGAAPREWNGDNLHALAVLAAATGGALQAVADLDDREVKVRQLQHALASRIVIEQAKGVLMGRTGMKPQDAFEGMRARARSSGRRLADIAGEVVDAATRRRRRA